MITTKKNLLMLLLFISCSIHGIAQTDYYYYRGQKMPLTLNESQVVASIPKDCDMISERIRANVQSLFKINDETFDIYVITQSDFENLTSLDFWEEDSKSVILTSSYYTENNIEVYASPYLNVQLKNEQDTDLLTSCADEYKLRVAGKSAFTPWYILSITQESEKSPVQCANELYESGFFAESVPDLVSFDELISQPTSVQAIVKPNAQKVFYNLQGQQISSKTQRGINIVNGKKVLVK